jgi:hypothetical protein
MSWHCPACRTEILHIVTHQVPDPSKTYRCQLCRLNLGFSLELRKMKIAFFQPRYAAAGTANTRPRPVSPVVGVKSTKTK